jgi:hypothetical protein
MEFVEQQITMMVERIARSFMESCLHKLELLGVMEEIQ